VRFLTGDRLFRLEYAEAHVAIRAGAPSEQPDNVVQHFLETPTAAYASRGYVEAYGKPESPAEFTKHRFVGPNREDSRAPFYVWLRENVPAEQVTFRCSDHVSAKYAVLGGAGIGFFPVREAETHADLVEVAPPRPEWTAPLWLVTHVDLHRTTKVQTILKFLKEHAKALQK
jgi:DNA-binding transcriptional LysR family regulator